MHPTFTHELTRARMADLEREMRANARTAVLDAAPHVDESTSIPRAGARLASRILAAVAGRINVRSARAADSTAGVLGVADPA